LQDRVEVLEEARELQKIAKDLAFRLHAGGGIYTEDLQEALDSFSLKSREELKVLDKAAELSKKAGKSLSFGNLSERPQDDGTLDPLTRLLVEDL
jgi:hypothetical protein